jgi:hypothetical protein
MHAQAREKMATILYKIINQTLVVIFGNTKCEEKLSTRTSTKKDHIPVTILPKQTSQSRSAVIIAKRTTTAATTTAVSNV